MSPIIQAGLFLVDTVFTFFMLALLLRILLQWVRADFYNPLCQWVLKVTNFMVIPMRRLVLAYWGIDWACVLLLFFVTLLKQGLLILLAFSYWANTLGLSLLAIADILELGFYVYLFAMITVAVSSWLNLAHHPLVQISNKIVAPFLNRIRRFLPDVGGLDLSPLVFTVILILLNILIIQVLMQQGIIIVSHVTP